MQSIAQKIRFLIMLALLAVPALSAMAQKQKIKNLPYYDQRLLHWGFCLGINAPDIVITHSGAETGEGWWATCPDLNVAFQVGLMGDLAITEHLNVRCSPMINFEERKITFARTTEDNVREETSQNLKTTYIEVPLSLKMSTRRINNYRPYLVAGAQASFDLGHEKETPIVFNRLDMGIHIGMGCDIYLPFFKLAPELRFNLGLIDLLDHERKGLQDASMRPYTDALLAARNKSVSLIFWFE